MKKIQVSVLLGVITFVGVASASNWALVGERIDPLQPKCVEVYSVDTESARKDGDVIVVWSKIERGPSHTACLKAKRKTELIHAAYNCSDSTVHFLGFIDYDWNGKNESGDLDSVMNIAPDTVADALLHAVCK